MFARGKFIKVFTIVLSLIGILVGIQRPCWSQALQYPDRPVNIVIGFPPAGGAGLSAQVIFPIMATFLGQPCLLNYKPGAISAIAADYVAKQKPDGYTLFWSAEPYLLTKVITDAKILTFKLEDFIDIGAAAFSNLFIVVNAKSPLKTIDEFIEFGRKNPGKLSYSTTGIGGGTHIDTELFGEAANIKFNHIPFPGGAQAMTALLGGHVDMTLSAKPRCESYIKSGMLRALAYMAKERDPQYRDVPTLKEKGYDVESTTWYRLVAPKGGPQSILKKLEDAFDRAVKDQNCMSRLENLGFSADYLNSKETERKIKSELPKYKNILGKLGLVK